MVRVTYIFEPNNVLREPFLGSSGNAVINLPERIRIYKQGEDLVPAEMKVSSMSTI